MNDGQYFFRHFHHNVVGIAVCQQPRQRTPACHAIPARVVDHDQVDAASLLALCGKTCPRTASDDRLAVANHTLKFRAQLVTRKTRHRLVPSNRSLHWPTIAKNSFTPACAKFGSLIWSGNFINFRRSVSLNSFANVSNNAASASGSQKGSPGASRAETPPSGSRKRTSPSHRLSRRAIQQAC